MRNKLGLGCIILGVLLLCGSLVLYLQNREEDHRAKEQATKILPQMIAEIPQVPSKEAVAERLAPSEFKSPEAFEMTEVEIDGYAYIGYLSIPALELNLPIMSQWDSARLKIAPCRYFGSVNGEDLVLMAHNYASHFGRIKELKLGDEVIFTDMDGFSTRYLVVNKDVLSPYAVEEITSGDFDLTLFTCTYGGENRIGVYCEIE